MQEVYGSLTVINPFVGQKRSDRLCRVVCKCGRTSIKRLSNLTRAKGCGRNCPFTIAATNEGRRRHYAKVIYGGVEYTKQELADQFGMTREGLEYRLQNDLPLSQKDVRKRRLYRGHPSSFWVKELGITRQAFHCRLAMYGEHDDRVYQVGAASAPYGLMKLFSGKGQA